MWVRDKESRRLAERVLFKRFEKTLDYILVRRLFKATIPIQFRFSWSLIEVNLDCRSTVIIIRETEICLNLSRDVKTVRSLVQIELVSCASTGLQ